jgi:hypothetical protein
LLVHEGELEDVRNLLCDLDIPFEEAATEVPTCEDGSDWALLIATPQRILKLGAQPDPGSRRVQVAIGDSDSRTLRNAMSRLNVDFFVRRPVHAEALRLLLLQTMYKGPEKRRARRVNIGLPVRFRTGLWRRKAILLDLSETGCRLLSRHPLERGMKLTVAVPAGRRGRSTLSLKGKVLRLSDPEGRTSNGRLAHIIFETLPAETHARLKRIVSEFASGPASTASFATGERDPEAMQRVDEGAGPQEFEDLEESRRETVALREGERPHAEPLPRPILDPQVEKAPERRSEPRRIFSRSVVALSDGATRILVGRDLSPGGMRTDPDPTLRVGDLLTVALPWRPSHPLVVKARVIRDDGERGLVLQFHELSEEDAVFVAQIASLLPICDLSFEDEEPAWVIVSEVLDQAR